MGRQVLDRLTSSARFVIAAALLPLVALAAASVVMVCSAAIGSPVWGPQDETLPEAVALQDRGEIARQIALGADPNRPGRVRPGMMDNEALTLTPLEAAVGIGRPDLVRLLRSLGAVPSAGEVRSLRCYADARESEARDALVDLSPEPWPDCRDVTLPNRR